MRLLACQSVTLVPASRSAPTFEAGGLETEPNWAPTLHFGVKKSRHKMSLGSFLCSAPKMLSAL